VEDFPATDTGLFHHLPPFCVSSFFAPSYAIYLLRPVPTNLVQGAEELKLVFAPEMTELVAYCRETDVKTAESEKKGALKAALLRLKNDSTIACAVQRSHEFKLLDSAPYWLTHLVPVCVIIHEECDFCNEIESIGSINMFTVVVLQERVLGDSYMPTSDDALRTR
jgi:hypothetical protein